jgi:MFS family permease
MSAVAIALGITALVAGVTGAWSPCGFSMVETLGAAAERGRRAVTGVACLTFTLGAVLGGAITFGGLALLGALLGGPDGALAVPVAVGIAVLAAVGEALGVRIFPQIRRQVPEPWRRGMPLPLASALYGVLLGLGFTTFVLTWAVWALAGICVALGSVEVGLAVGAAFGIGRALPVILMAPTAADGAGNDLLASMAERPGWLRLLRSTDAVALAAAALLLGLGGSSAVAATVERGGSDPSAFGGDLAWQRPGPEWVIRRDGRHYVLGGEDPAVGGNLVAWRLGETVTAVRRSSLEPAFTVDIPGADKLAVSDDWLVVRRTDDGVDRLEARPVSDPSQARVVASVPAPGQIGRPALSGDRLVFGLVKGRASTIRQIDLASGAQVTLRRRAGVEYTNPSLLGSALLYVRVTRCFQDLVLARGSRERVLLRRRPLAEQDAGHTHGRTRQGSRTPCGGLRARAAGKDLLWSTALTARAAFVTVLRPGADGAPRATLLSVPR